MIDVFILCFLLFLDICVSHSTTSPSSLSAYISAVWKALAQTLPLQIIILIPLPFFTSLYIICFHLNGVYAFFFAHKTHQTVSSLRLWILFGDIQESTQ